MKFISFLLFILLSNSTFSNTTECFEDILTKLAKEHSIPSCDSLANFEQARGKRDNLAPLCEKCKQSFEMITTTKIPSFSDHDKRKEYLNAALSDYKKVVIANLLKVAKLRGSNSTNASFDNSVKACRLKQKNDFVSACKSTEAKKLIQDSNLFEELSNQTGNELAKILSDDPNFNPKNTLSIRSKPQCFIKEKEILSLTSATLEEAFTPQMIQNIKKLKASDFDSMDELAAELSSSELLELMQGHPLLSLELKDPASFISFFQSIPSPESNDSIRLRIYNKTSGQQLDQKIASICNDSFNHLVESVCNDEFDKGSIYIDPFKNYDRINPTGFQPALNSLVSNEEDYQKNLKLLKYCDKNLKTGKLDMLENLDKISSTVPLKLRQSPLNTYRQDTYLQNVGNINEFICSTDPKSCEGKSTFNCLVLQKYHKRKKNPSSLDSRIASSSNEEINKLLRSMIGTPTDPEARSILINNGILPKSDGTIVAQPEVPERKPENFAKAIKQEIQNTKQVAALSPASIPRRSSDAHEERSSYDNHTSLSSPASSSSALNDNTANLQDSIKKQKQEFEDVQEEIRRRLSGLPNKKPSSMTEARKIASESFASRGRKYSPDQVTSFAEQMMGPQTDVNAPITAPSFSGSSSGDRSTVSGGKTKAEQFRESQKQQALMGMAGAQQSALNDSAGTTGAEASKAKELAKINLNIAEDPKVTLSDIFAQKMQLNDNETQKLKELLKQNNNFVLQVKDMNFKVLFNEKNAFNLLLESGDKREAERIRPQLEIFLNKLKRNNTLHNLNQTWST